MVCLFLFCGMEMVSPYEIGGEGGKCLFFESVYIFWQG